MGWESVLKKQMREMDEQSNPAAAPFPPLQEWRKPQPETVEEKKPESKQAERKEEDEGLYPES